jgi:hypothetical protein
MSDPALPVIGKIAVFGLERPGAIRFGPIANASALSFIRS